MNQVQNETATVEIAVVHAGVTIYRVPVSDPSLEWSYTTCAICALRSANDARPHTFDVRCLSNPKRLDLETSDAATRRSSIAEILRHGTECGEIAPHCCDTAHYMLDFAVPLDTPGSYLRALFALYGWPRVAADAFFADVSLAIRSGRFDLLLSEQRLVENALDAAASAGGCEPYRRAIEADIVDLLRARRSA